MAEIKANLQEVALVDNNTGWWNETFILYIRMNSDN